MKRSKIISLEELTAICKKLKKQGKTIGQCHGCFDLLHPGHIKHFEAAKEKVDILVVTITPDRFVNKGPGRPVFPEQLRMESIAALDSVDYVALNHCATATNTIKLIQPDYYIKGQDYKEKEKDVTKGIYEEETAVKSVGGKLYFTEEITFSSSRLINAFFSPHSSNTRDYINRLKKKYSAEDIVAEIEKMNKLKIMVIGDTIIDEYHYCLPLGKSSKSPTISSIFLREEVFAGGVLAVANHLEQFASEVKLVTCLGKKNLQKDIINKTLSKGVDAHFFERTDGPTNTKRRYIDKYMNVKLFEVTFMNDHNINAGLEKEIIDYLKTEIPKYDIVLVADFGHGFITPAIIKHIESAAKYLAVNAQTNSNNYGFNYITKYNNADYISIDEKELRLPFGDNYADVEALVKKLKKVVKAGQIQITLGQEGTILYRNNKFYRAPAFARSVKDSVGAGDAVLAVTTLCAYQQTPPEPLCFIGNCVGAMAVEIIGNEHPVYKKDLIRFIQHFLK